MQFKTDQTVILPDGNTGRIIELELGGKKSRAFVTTDKGPQWFKLSTLRKAAQPFAA